MLSVKEGPLNAAGWVKEHDQVQRFALNGQRIGVLRQDGVLLVKEGPLNAGWVKEHDQVQSFILSGNRIAILRQNGVLSVKEGPLNAGWVEEHDQVQSFTLSGDLSRLLCFITASFDKGGRDPIQKGSYLASGGVIPSEWIHITVENWWPARAENLQLAVQVEDASTSAPLTYNLSLDGYSSSTVDIELFTGGITHKVVVSATVGATSCAFRRFL